jgi:antitoxin HicB
MRLAYPVDLIQEPEGGFTVTFPDVPEAITHGRNREEALDAAASAAAVA